MTGTKPSTEMLLKARIAKHSVDRLLWNQAKKKAAKDIDPDAAFKKVKGALGDELDKLRDMVEGAKKFIKAYPDGLDAQGKQIVENQVAKCRGIIRGYQKVCQAEASKAGIKPAKKEAWKDLYEALHLRDADLDNNTRTVLR